jgi:DNA repair protein RadC
MFDIIADLPMDDRPRERLLKHGAPTLSDAELLAILLGSGTTGKNVLELSRQVLIGGKTALARRGMKELVQIRGMGPAKAMRIAAAFELARRVAANDEEEPLLPVFDMDALGRSLMGRFRDYGEQERLGAVFLDARKRVVKEQMIFAGTIDRAMVSTRDIIRIALEQRATGVVLFHNHPSGDTSPSAEDLSFTHKICAALDLCDIKLVDHLIVAPRRYLSMAQRMMLNLQESAQSTQPAARAGFFSAAQPA